jgi:hypothetical protein
MWCGNSAASQQSVYEWIERFRNGCTCIKNEEGARLAAEGNLAAWHVSQPKTFYSEGIKKVV